MKAIFVLFIAASVTLSCARPTFDKIAEVLLNAIDGDPYAYPQGHPTNYQEGHYQHYNHNRGYQRQPGYSDYPNNYYPSQGGYAQGPGPYVHGPYAQGAYADRPYAQGPYVQEPYQGGYAGSYPAGHGYHDAAGAGGYGVTVSAGYQPPAYPQQHHGYKTHGY